MSEQPQGGAGGQDGPMPLLEHGEIVNVAPAGRDWWLVEPPRPRKKKPWPRAANGSASRVKLALSCMERFASKYRDRRADPMGPAALVGKLIHGAREDAALRRMNPRVNDTRGVPSVASTAELLHLLDHQAAQLASEGEPPGSDLTPEVFEDAQNCTRAAGDEDYRNTILVEHSFLLRVEPSPLVLGGYIDRVDVFGPDRTNPHTVLVYDYKTTQELPTKDELAYDPQPGIYMAWARRAWPRAREIRFVIRNTRHGRDTSPLIWNETYDALHMGLCRAAYSLWTDTSQRKAAVGDHCGHCPYREGDGRFKPCAAYEKELERLRAIEHAPGGMDRLELDELLRIYREASTGSDMLESRRKEARQAILGKLPKGQKSYRSGDLLAYTSQDRVRDFNAPLDFVKELATAAGVDFGSLARDVFKIKKEALDAFCGGVRDEQKKLEMDRVIDRHQSLGVGALKLTVRRSESMF